MTLFGAICYTICGIIVMLLAVMGVVRLLGKRREKKWDKVIEEVRTETVVVSKEDDEHFFMQTIIKSRLDKLPCNDNEALQQVRFLMTDYGKESERSMLLAELQARNPHVKELTFADSNSLKVVLGSVVQYIPSEAPNEGKKASEEDRDEDFHAWKAPSQEDRILAILGRLEIITNTIEKKLQTSLKETMVLEMYRGQTDEKLAHTIEVLTKTFGNDNVYLQAARAVAAERMELFASGEALISSVSKEPLPKPRKKRTKKSSLTL